MDRLASVGSGWRAGGAVFDFGGDMTAAGWMSFIAILNNLLSIMRDSVAGAIFFGALLIALEILAHGDTTK